MKNDEAVVCFSLVGASALSFLQCFYAGGWGTTRAQQLLTVTVPQQSGTKSGGGLLCSFPWGVGSPSNTISPGAKAYFCTMWYADPPSRLATIAMG